MHRPRLQSHDSDRPTETPRTVSALVAQRSQYRFAVSALLAAALILGCARQYHWYDCGCHGVNYNYCPPAPLPYTPYCSCPTPIAKSYFRHAAQPDAGQAIPDDPASPDGSARQ